MRRVGMVFLVVPFGIFYIVLLFCDAYTFGVKEKWNTNIQIYKVFLKEGIENDT